LTDDFPDIGGGLMRGHNNPPTMIQVCDSVAEDISGWLAEHPIIQGEDEAKEAKLHLDRGKLSLKDMEDERDKAVRPLNEQVKAINEAYRPTKIIIGKIIEEVGKRIESFIQTEERKRIAAAQEAARLAAEAEARAREAERNACEAIDSANVGELGVDIKSATVASDAAIREAERAARAAQIAAKESRVKVSGGFSRATSLRKVKRYLIGIMGEEDHMKAAIKALTAVGLTKDISEAITKAAKDYHEEYGEIPPGIIVYEERKI